MGEDRAASQAIATMLMVSVTVIMATMVGATFLTVASGVDTGGAAGVTVDADSEADTITVTFVSSQHVGVELEVTVDPEGGGSEFVQTADEVGEDVAFSLSDGGYEVTVVAVDDGKRRVVHDTTEEL
jgi:FlaG/FlaF family flagellin (archaellin)